MPNVTELIEALKMLVAWAEKQTEPNWAGIHNAQRVLKQWGSLDWEDDHAAQQRGVTQVGNTKRAKEGRQCLTPSRNT